MLFKKEAQSDTSFHYETVKTFLFTSEDSAGARLIYPGDLSLLYFRSCLSVKESCNILPNSGYLHKNWYFNGSVL